MLGAFLFYHLWKFDRFKCLRWNNGPYNGAFKRVMTYSYLLSLPLIFTFALGFTIIKYQNGYILMEGHGIIPTPYNLWDQPSQAAIFPLMLCFSVGWSLEMVTHLEELCFWLFLVNAGSAQQDWFKSLYFRTWLVGSTTAVLYMPLVTIFTRDDHLKNEAYTFLAGSLGSLSLTLWFIPILWAFPAFLDSLREDNVDTNTIIRLTKFHELNTMRIGLRFLFTVPLLILGVDGIRPHQHVNESALWTDILAMLAAFGCATSSGITLVIFFPRSIEGEMAIRDQKQGNIRLNQFATTSQHGSSPSVATWQDAADPRTAAYLIDDDDQLSHARGHISKNQHQQQYMTQRNPSGGVLTQQVNLDTRILNQTTDWSPSAKGQPRWKVEGGHTDGEEVLDTQSAPAPTHAQLQPGVVPTTYGSDMPLRPNRRGESALEMGTLPPMQQQQLQPPGRLSRQTTKGTTSGQLTENNLSRHNAVNPMVHNFRSPIDVMYGPRRRPGATNHLEFQNNESRLTFTPRR